MSFFRELKRRNVFKVATAYVVVAWLVMQVSDVVLNNVEAPGWVFHVLMLFLGIGFIFAVFFAWEFELTPDGLKREREVDPATSITDQTGQKLNLTIIAVLVLALGYFVYDKFVLAPDSEPALAQTDTAEPAEPVEEAAGTDRSIAVLPFADMSPDNDQEYFSDGLSEELLNLLAKIPELRVAARTSAWSYKGKDIKIDQVGRELGVAHVLEGSVRTAGDRIRVTAQLIKSDDGFHLWSETYDRTLDDVFAIQDEISAAVVGALKVTLLGEAPHVKEIDPQAYALFLQAQHLSNQLRRENYQKAIDLYRQVLAIEPGYAPAWSGISRNYRNMAIDQQVDEVEGFRLAFEAVEKALEFDPNLAEAHARKGSLLLDWRRDTVGAARHHKKAMELNSNDPDALQGLAAFAVFVGRADKAAEFMEAAVIRDPVDALAHLRLGDYYAIVGRLEDAEKSYRVALNLNPELLEGYYKLGGLLIEQGRPVEALAQYDKELDAEYRVKGRAISFHALGRMTEFEAEFEKLRTEYGKTWPSEIAHVYAWTGQPDQAFEWLNRAIDIKEGGITTTSRHMRWLKPLHDDPRWDDYLERLGISDADIAAIDFEF